MKRFFDDLPDPLDHVLITAGGPHYVPLLEMDSADVREALSDHVVLGLEVARNARGKMRPGGSLLLMGGTGGRKISRELGIVSAATPYCLRSRALSSSARALGCSRRPARTGRSS